MGVGQAQRRLRDLHKIVHEASDACMAEMRDGAPAIKPHEALKGVIVKDGMDHFRQHTSGYGMAPGFPPSWGEPTNMFGGSKDVLRAGMVISVEPAVFIKEERIGVRLIDNCLITRTVSRCCRALRVISLSSIRPKQPMQRSDRETAACRARIGIAVPSVNTVMEPWAQRCVPHDVSLHFSRMFIPDVISRETLIEMDRNEGMAAIRQLASTRPNAIAYGCTASSIVQGLEYDVHLRAEIEDTCKVAATTAAHAILEAVKVFGARRVSLVSPYTEAVAAAEHGYFASAGLVVVGGAHLGISDGFRLAEPDPPALFRLGVDGWDNTSEALIISCLNTRSHAVIAELEEAIGKPVITSTQATLWHALRLAGVEDRIPGYGRLLLQH